jgi:hypothetical protein
LKGIFSFHAIENTRFFVRDHEGATNFIIQGFQEVHFSVFAPLARNNKCSSSIPVKIKESCVAVNLKIIWCEYKPWDLWHSELKEARPSLGSANNPFPLRSVLLHNLPIAFLRQQPFLNSFSVIFLLLTLIKAQTIP